MNYTRGSFRNLIKEQEREETEAVIWKQIDTHQYRLDDYVIFSLAAKDGTYKTVYDHGRIVENRYYGNIFYAFIIGKDNLKKYKECWANTED